MKNIWELLVMIAAVIVAAIFIPPLIRPVRSRDYPKSMACNANLSQIGKACGAYQEDNGDFFPAFWDGDRFDPTKSLAMLYPRYISEVRAFSCPTTNDRPEITVTMVAENDRRCAFGPVDTYRKCSYFYDERTSSRVGGPVACDADGQTWRDAAGKPPGYPPTWMRKLAEPNHAGRQNVLYFAGHVTWTSSLLSDADPRDNIFCPTGDAAGPWDSDTDAYLWDGVNARPMEVAK